MIKLFFDIETLPCDDCKRQEYLPILKKKSRKKEVVPVSDDALYLSTSFEGTFGRICCIGYIKENGKVTKDVLCGEEKEILQKFWEIVQDVELFVGHNIWEFDFPFIYKRSIILGVKPRLDITFARYRNQPIFDTMKVWELWSNGAQKLDTLAKVLGLPTSKDEMDGSMVWPYYQQGKLKEICKYCLKDVELTRKVYYRMVFEDMMEEVAEVVDSPSSV
ncbi:MAG: hypothetical protein UU73_C0001G0267 [Candidatus Daviesbacteria bacterium GW2011_GWA1_41_61]|uniref:Predicted 3'-5' exonuclease PolB-like domain-containing protein n=1 Tax=Candidatus Daviesbacteria bacterium GW2011_GWA2_40_9 TaxID=1618424 RepID=A0A0G0U346_9BACT|nr:MAG: hypothetical protein UU26_C0013G0024 [Candidatus Daviesbacteria bacterium GW2011_GWC1_40_9]KKR83518.1 MAG: hypothetical protein UU29_C0004G0019 [Candidatus Daviesbacteria bacterium GW2011_GWA2_40_9]KKR93086.1 MAG: hypothetical protein UU44_C0004G0268 [Candidatus Daviesbacteria bacterium GW2011_GWB1_41_15]KKS15630.1 MAG: hypothetical protein UU73_C0001G0267 [Candidatus Daviesbacteria bacterium GW2011_GWA1_41_61]